MLFQLLADNSNSFRCWLIWPLTVMLILCCVPGFLTGSISKAFRVVINFGYNYTLYFTCSVAESVALQNYAYAIKTKLINLHQCQECAQEYTCKCSLILQCVESFCNQTSHFYWPTHLPTLDFTRCSEFRNF